MRELKLRQENLIIDAEKGLLIGAKFLPSPNYDVRPQGIVIDLLVIHCISLPPGEFGTTAIDELFCNQLDCNTHPYYQQLNNLKVSAHLLIQRDGNITQYVPFHYRAWHAGESSFLGRTSCNDFSIGIELEGSDYIPYTSLQYDLLSIITTKLIKVYPKISFDRIVGHSTIAPKRKTDPGPSFDWSYFYECIGYAPS